MKVVDGPSIITRAEMTDKRVRSIGSLTYAVTLTEDSFIELTQDYVENADSITLRITRNGLPVTDARVELRHKFVMESGSIMQQLPHMDRAFITNNDGKVAFCLGKPSYIGEFKDSEEFYWIYVNAQNTSLKVTSSGTGLIQPILEIEVS